MTTLNEKYQITWSGIDSGDFMVNGERFDFNRISIRKYEIKRHRSSCNYLTVTSLKRAIELIEE